eukprot:scaffold676998_cov50-Prasinocladus_malaysianus.AAC.1
MAPAPVSRFLGGGTRWTESGRVDGVDAWSLKLRLTGRGRSLGPAADLLLAARADISDAAHLIVHDR